MRLVCTLLLVLSGCALDSDIVHWNLDAAGCAAANAVTVRWVFENGASVLDEVDLPCARGDYGVEVHVAEGTTRQRAALLDSGGTVLASCVSAPERGGEWCTFTLP